MKSIFTKLSTLLFCGVVAMVGCTDFSEDIQAVDVKVDGLTTELNNYKTSTAATIAELQSAIAALEETQEQMAADYAKKSELEAAKSELQDKLNTLNSNIEKAAADAATAIAALDAAKADKSEVVALKETVETAIAEANAAIAALDAAKADKTQVDKIAGDVATLIEGYQQMIAQFQNLSLIVDGKAEQADLELVQADVNSLKQGYMETVSALQNLAGRMEAAEGAIELAEGDIADLKKAAAEAVFAITNLNAQVEALDARVEALEGEMKKVQSEIALHTETLQNLAGRLEAAEGAIEDEAAAREKADKALQDAVSLLNMGLTNLKTSYEIHVEEFEAYKNNMAKAMDDLAAQDAALALSILDYYNQSIAAVDTAIETLRKEQAEAIAALEDKILKAWEDERALIYKTINDIQHTLETMIEEGDAALQEMIEQGLADAAKTMLDYYYTLFTAIEEGDAALKEMIEQGLADAAKTALDHFNTLFTAIEEGDAALLEKIELGLAEAAKTTLSYYYEIQAEIADLRSELEALAATVTMDVEALLARVQSLVYVPEYNDHKATMEWAYITSPEGYVIAPKQTVLKYRVHAVADEDPAKAASELAAAWKSKMANLYYSVESVKVRGTEAGLNIVDVKAVGEDLHVTVLAENFADSFYGQFSVATEEGVQVSETSSYSASLVLTDGNNNRSTEYTNLVPGEPFELSFRLFVPVEAEDVDAAAVAMVENGQVIEYLMPCNDYEKVETAYAPIPGFVSFDEEVMAARPASQPYFSVEELVTLGYEVEVEKAARIVRTDESYHNQPYDGKVDGVDGDPCYKIGEEPEYDFHYSVKEGTTFDHVDEYSTVTYTYSFGGASSSLVYKFTLANAQVAVDMTAEATWTIAIMDSLFEGTHYAKSYTIENVPFTSVGGPVAHLTPVLNSPAVMESITFYAMDAEGEWKEVADRSFILSAFNDNATVDIEMIGGTYSWNNSYKIVWKSTNDDDNVDYTTTAIVNLVGKPEKIDVEIPVKFVLKGANTWFEAPADLCGEAFKQLDQYLEYGDSAADKAKWESVFASYVTRYNALELGMPVVNGETSHWIANLDQLATAKLFIGKNKIYEDQPNVITWSVKPWWDVPVNFTITGDVTVPATAENFIYSQDYVKDINTRPYAEVFGKIEEVKGVEEGDASKKYSIIKSDLAKYFNLDIESLEGHNYTVDFEVTLPDAESEIGNVKVLPNTTTPVVTDKGAATYYYFLQDQTVLDWDTYRGLEVIVNATLKVNGYTVDSKKLTLITKDPLTLTGADFSVTRNLRDNTPINVYKSLVLTSSVEKEFANLLTTDKKAVNETESNVAADLATAEAYANQVYGADIKVVLGPKGVYYYDNTGKPIILGTNKYGYDEETGILTIYGDDANVKNYYAEFTAVMSSVICGGEHKVPFRVTATVAK